MMPPMAAVGAYMIATGVFTSCVHFEPTAAVGSNCHIWLVEPTLMLNPPSMYSLLPVTAKPPGRIVPPESPGQLSAAVRVVRTSVTGLYKNTCAVAVVCVAAEPPTQQIIGAPETVST